MFRAFYVAPGFAEPREDLLVDEILKTHLGDDQLPRRRHGVGELAGVRARHVGHPQRALAALLPLGRHRRPRPQAAGAVDARRARTSSWPTARRWRWARSARSGAVPGWPGADVYPPQPMVAQIRAVLERYAEAGGVGARRDHRGLGPRAAPRRRPALARDLPGVPYDDRVNDRRRSGLPDRWRDVHASGKIRPDPGAALLELYDAALPQVYGYLLARCGRRALAEDLTAETFLAAVAACQAGAAADAQHRLAGRHRPAQARRPLAGRRAGDPRALGGRR